MWDYYFSQHWNKIIFKCKSLCKLIKGFKYNKDTIHTSSPFFVFSKLEHGDNITLMDINIHLEQAGQEGSVEDQASCKVSGKT